MDAEATTTPPPAARSKVVDEGGRQADLAAIHIAKKQLQWSESEYRDVLWAVCLVRSSADLDFAGRKRFLDHLRKCGFENKARRRVQPNPFTPRQRKIWSLWQQLVDAGRVHHRTLRALDGYVRRQTGVDHVTWLTKHQQDLVIESLKAWLKRPGGGATDAA